MYYREFTKNAEKYYVSGTEEGENYSVVLAKEVGNAWNIVATINFNAGATEEDIDQFLNGYFGS